MKSKIKTLVSLKKLSTALKKKGKKFVFTNGCFDLIHYGHVSYLAKARKLGDYLIVALNSDSSVRKLKGEGRPLINEKDRAGLLAALECIDFVVLFNEDTPYKTIVALEPDILVKGADYKINDIAGSDIVRKSGGKVIRIPLVKGRSTSSLIKKIIHTYAGSI